MRSALGRVRKLWHMAAPLAAARGLSMGLPPLVCSCPVQVLKPFSRVARLRGSHAEPGGTRPHLGRPVHAFSLCQPSSPRGGEPGMHMIPLVVWQSGTGKR